MNTAPRARPRSTQRGAALLVAMLLLTLVATMAAGMVWQQWRAVEVEAAERGRVQIAWLMNGALDWGRLILRRDANNTARRGEPTSLRTIREWQIPESRLSTFLSVDAGASGDGPEAFLSGAMTDAQSRYNLRNLAADGKIAPEELELLKRLCANVGLADDTAGLLAEGLLAAQLGTDEQAAVAPMRLDDLAWIGLGAEVIDRLRPVATVLPIPTKVNVNTAPREVLAAVIEGVDLGTAERLVQAREREPFKNLEAARAQLPTSVTLKDTELATTSDFFEIRGRLRVEGRVLDEVSVVQRSGLDVFLVQRERAHAVLPGAP